MLLSVLKVPQNDENSAFFGKELDCWDIINYLFPRKVVIWGNKLKGKI